MTSADNVLEFRRDTVEQWLSFARAGKDLTIASVNAGFEIWVQQTRAQAALAQRLMSTWMDLCSGASRRFERTS